LEEEKRNETESNSISSHYPCPAGSWLRKPLPPDPQLKQQTKHLQLHLPEL
jgi:hypothetical protein